MDEIIFLSKEAQESWDKASPQVKKSVEHMIKKQMIVSQMKIEEEMRTVQCKAVLHEQK